MTREHWVSLTDQRIHSTFTPSYLVTFVGANLPRKIETR
jgi:hypothetical protein